MKRTESECVDCGLPCKGKSCPYYSVTRYYCDKCGDEAPLYHYDGEELCIECIKKLLEKVEDSENA